MAHSFGFAGHTGSEAYSTLLLQHKNRHGQHVNTWTFLHSNKTSLIKWRADQVYSLGCELPTLT